MNTIDGYLGEMNARPWGPLGPIGSVQAYLVGAPGRSCRPAPVRPLELRTRLAAHAVGPGRTDSDRLRKRLANHVADTRQDRLVQRLRRLR